MRIATAISMAALALSGAVAAPKEAVTALDAPEVKRAFSRGAPLLETADYKIHASRREAPGKAEVHERDTDILYVLEGSATLVTGGTIVAGRLSGPEEVRGDGIVGGQAHALAPGDVLVVPHGVAHQFTAVTAPFLYYVVKVPTGNGGGR